MPDSTKISVFNMLQVPFAISTEEGEQLFSLIEQELRKSNNVTLDFSNINIIVSTFLNASIGQLYGKYDSDFIKEHLTVENMSSEDLAVLKKVTDRAKEYFSDKNNLEDFFKKHFPNA
jgi:hypothetical protein